METLAGLFRATRDLQTFCKGNRWDFCFIGGVALQRWGEPRTTQDADLTLLTRFRDEEKFIDALLLRFSARRADAREFALRNRVLLLQHESGVGLDVALGGLPFEERCVERASPWQINPDLVLTTCSAEDLVVHKAFAARMQDWADIINILVRQGPKLNLDQIWTELRPLIAIKEEPQIEGQLQKLIDLHLR